MYLIERLQALLDGKYIDLAFQLENVTDGKKVVF
jgi:hypothetical protein